MATEIKRDCMDGFVRGIDAAYGMVAPTLGPGGGTVYLDDEVVPKITTDGFNILSRIDLGDKVENMGVKILKSCASRTVDEAGDGTTTTTILAHAVLHECLKRPENGKKIRNSLLEALPAVVRDIKRASRKLKREDVRKIALISSESRELADAIAAIIDKVGPDAVITVEDSPDDRTSYATTDGYELYSGFMDPRFVNRQGKAQCVMENVAVVVCERKVSAMVDLMAILNQAQAAGLSECVFVVEDIDSAVLGQLIINKMMGRFSSVVVRAVGDSLKDVEACVGATRISDSTGVSFQTFSAEHFGRCKRVTADHQRTVFIPESGRRGEAYSTVLREKAAEERNQFVRDRILRRASQMTGGVAVLRIGSSNFNREGLKDKADDAIKAVRSALQEGVVEGGAMCLYRIGQAMRPRTPGGHIIKKALSAPLRCLIENAGEDYASVVKGMPDGMGYDASSNSYRDLFAAGVIDPAKVERVALTNAVTDVANLITSHGAIHARTEPK